MKNATLFLLTVICFGFFSQERPMTDADGALLDGLYTADIEIYSSLEDTEPVSVKHVSGLRLVGGYLHNINDYLSDVTEGYIRLEIGGRQYGIYRYSNAPLRRTDSDRGVILETMDADLNIGREGHVTHVRSDMGIKTDTPEADLDVNGDIILGSGVAANKILDEDDMASDDASALATQQSIKAYVDEHGGTSEAVYSVSSEADRMGRIGHMMFVPTEGTEITESDPAHNDTIYIAMGTGASAPCSAPPAPPIGVVGPTTVCEMAEGVAYAVPPVAGANFYYWELPSESYIVSGSGTNSVVINFGSTDGDISVYSSNDCGASASPVSLAITMNHPPLMPGSITGEVSVCEGATESYSIGAVSGATSYTWSLPSGAFISSGYGTNSVSVTFASTSGTVCVTADNSCGSSEPQCMPVTVFGSLSGVLPGAITGSSSVCSGATDVAYSISDMSDATSYSWTVPSEASIVSGSGTNTILVDFGTASGDVSVSASNSCGTSDSRVLAVSVSPNSVGGSISGPTSICIGSETGTMTLSGNVGSVTKWQKSRDGGGWVDISRTEITYSETPSLAGAWEYRAEVRSGACSAVYSASHTVNVSPTSVGGEVSGGSSPICLGSSTGTLTLSGHTGDIDRWQRSSDGGSTWTDISHIATSYSETPPSAGTWLYRAVVESSPCSEDFSIAQSIVVSPSTVAGNVTGGTSPICLGSATGTLTLSGHTGDILRWQRSTDAGATWADITGTATTYSETPGSAGSYTYRAVVQSGACAPQNSGSVTIEVSPSTVAGSVTGGTSPICLGSSTGTITLSGYTGEIVRWQRTTDGGSSWTDISHTTASYSETPGSTGTYQYRAVVQSGACSELFSSPTSPIVVNPVPTSAFTVSSINPPTTFNVSFEAAESGATYAWTFPGGTPATSTSPTPTVVWSSTGSYTVSYTVTKGGCTSNRDTTITVRSPLTETFYYTGSPQNWTVPTGVTYAKIECWGAEGGDHGPDEGEGGYCYGHTELTPGEILGVYVGGQGGLSSGGYSAGNYLAGSGGWNGGGDAGTQYAGGGGGGTDVRRGGSGLANRIIVAGGGGGSGENGDAGNGGGLTGGAGEDGAGGGTQTAGGTGGGAEAGSLGLGGHGLSDGGGGGGGYYGGAGDQGDWGNDGGGGGGSSYYGSMEEPRGTSSGVRSGHGMVTITY